MADDDADLERLLKRYQPAGPGGGVRARLLRRAAARSRWAFAEGIAALLLVGLTLAQVSASVTQFIPPPPAAAARVDQIAAALAALDLPLSRAAQFSMATQLAAGERLLPLPRIRGPRTAGTSLGVTP